ncbi:hypothetical protein [Microbacterium aureliae]
MTDQQNAEDPRTDQDATSRTDAPLYGVGPFTLREVVLGGIWVLALVVSFFPVYGRIGSGPSVWASGIDWVLTIGVPTVAVFLLALRRLSPDGIRRVGSLGIDQFASVAFSVAAVLWLAMIWNSFLTLAANGVFLATWVAWVEFFLMLAGVLLTVAGPFIPPFSQDFAGRREVAAHRNARPVRAVTPRPAPTPAPVAPEAADEAAPSLDDTIESRRTAPTAATTVLPGDERPSDVGTALEGSAPAGTGARPEDAAAADPASVETVAWAPEQTRGTYEPVEDASAEPVAEQQPAARRQAFWALAPEERDVVDEVGIPLFRIGPTAWALVIEDRGEVFVVRHDDGRIGYLHEVDGITRG